MILIQPCVAGGLALSVNSILICSIEQIHVKDMYDEDILHIYLRSNLPVCQQYHNFLNTVADIQITL